MSRMQGEPIIQKPQDDLMTVLLAVALLAEVAALIVIFVRAKNLFPTGGLF